MFDLTNKDTVSIKTHDETTNADQFSAHEIGEGLRKLTPFSHNHVVRIPN